jgi:cytochrome P450
VSTTTPADFKLNPFPGYEFMRQTSPVYFDESHGLWTVFKYDDVKRVLSDYQTFSSRFGGEAGSGGMFGASLIGADPPRHRQLRSLVTLAFTPQAVEALAPRITAIVDQLLDAVQERGTLDVIHDLAYPLPVIVIAEMLGIPSGDRARFKFWSDAVVSDGSDPAGGHAEGSRNVYQEMGEYFGALIERRRQSPGSDLISGLLRAQIHGEHLSLRELLGFCSLLLVAGNETTTNLIGNAILCFDEQPDQAQRLRADPSLLESAIEEVLRFRSPVQAMFRRCVSDTQVSAQSVPAGSSLLAMIGSANRDESQFPNADKFDVARAPNRHLAFGHGIHYCLGAPLARLEAHIALRAMLERFRDFGRVPGSTLEPLNSFIVYGVKSLPIAFTRA